MNMKTNRSSLLSLAFLGLSALGPTSLPLSDLCCVFINTLEAFHVNLVYKKQWEAKPLIGLAVNNDAGEKKSTPPRDAVSKLGERASLLLNTYSYSFPPSRQSSQQIRT